MRMLTRTLTVFLFLAANAFGQVPRTISFQGVLADANGNVVADGNHQLRLLLYTSATGGAGIYAETQTIPVVRGVFNVIIGSVTPISPAIAFDRAYFLGVSVDGGAELTPRTALTAVPYALRAATADVAESLAPTATGAVTSVNGEAGAILLKGAGGTTVTGSGKTFAITSSYQIRGAKRAAGGIPGARTVGRAESAAPQ